MKTVKTICLVALFTMAFTSCKNDVKPEVKTVAMDQSKEVASNELDPNANYTKVEFGIEGMTCKMGCANTIEKKMAKMEGVKSAKVDFDKQLAMVEYDDAKVTPQSLEEAVAKVGDVYKVKDMKVVEEFGAKKELCQPDCDKACCAKKTEAEKMACAKDCKKACCADKKENKSE
jgi:Cu+-exporting ATPase